MKKLALTIIISVAGVALSAEEFTIQTISAHKENSITPAFEKKVEKSSLESVKKKEGNCNIVTVGRYDSVKKARADLSKAKKIAKDAFVRPVARALPASCAAASGSAKKEEKTAKAAVAAAAKGDANASGPAGKLQAVTEKPAQNAASPLLQGATVAEKPAVTAAESQKEGAAAEAPPVPLAALNSVAKPRSEESSRTTVLLYDRNMARKSDIHEAIEYYKTSPYHTFKPVALQSR